MAKCEIVNYITDDTCPISQTCQKDTSLRYSMFKLMSHAWIHVCVKDSLFLHLAYSCHNMAIWHHLNLITSLILSLCWNSIQNGCTRGQKRVNVTLIILKQTCRHIHILTEDPHHAPDYWEPLKLNVGYLRVTK